MKRKNTKTSRARSFMQSHPAASPNEIAYRFDLSKQAVYVLRSKLRKDGWKPAKRSEQFATLAPAGPVPEYYQKPAQQSAAGSAPLEIEMYEDEVDVTLDARAVEYGKFIEGAEVMQMLKRVVQNALNNRDKILAHDQAEAMDMIIHKIGRIVNGNPDVVDHWLDIAGYAQLVADRLNGRIR
jgi:hypothetical protein